MLRTLQTICFAALAAISLSLSALSEPLPPLRHDDKPNIVIILADDLGNADLGYRGSDIRTPNIDELASHGVRLEAFYGMPACTMARAEIMTGRYAFRFGLEERVLLEADTHGLPTEERTLPQALKDAGYQTAMVGKWHLGHADPKYWPQNRGFDYFYGSLTGKVDYYTKELDGRLDWQRNGTFVSETGYHTRLIGSEAVNIIERHDATKPLFLYFAAQAPHVPYQAPPDTTGTYKDLIADKDRRIYAAMVTELDTQVGRIMEALRRKGILENTLIIFTSDNGGDRRPLKAVSVRSEAQLERSGGGSEWVRKRPASNGMLRGGKATLYEGGVRVPAIFNWPAKLQPRIVNEPLSMVDLAPTILALAGGVGRPDRPFDGKNIWPTVAAGHASPHKHLLINLERSRAALRKGTWKLITNTTGGTTTELYNLATDPAEQDNVARQFPGVVRNLEAQLRGYAKARKASARDEKVLAR